MQTPLPAELFVPNITPNKKNMLFLKGYLTLFRPARPLRVTWLPFYHEFARQVTKEINTALGRKLCGYYEFQIFKKSKWYEGEPYVERTVHDLTGMAVVVALHPWLTEPMDRINTVYTDVLTKRHHNGYAYARLNVINKLGFGDSSYMWIRWKSLHPDYEYIEADDALELTSNDIRFEICTELPIEIIEDEQRRYKEHLDLDEWKEFMTDEDHLPKRRKKVNE
jgi:hypothetical protein